MNISRLQRILYRIIELGPAKTTHLINNRLQEKYFIRTWRSKALSHTAHHTWQTIARKHHYKNSFTHFLAAQRTKKLSLVINRPTTLIEQAKAATQNCFDLLGSGPCCFTQIPWHTDFRLHAQQLTADYIFDATSFYKDIQIQTGTTSNIRKDIKVPWELSRCQHLPVLGAAYELTHDAKYADTFTAHISSWIEHNPYLLGINWLCPMEVGIRALNWILAWHYFRNSSTISNEFWQHFISTLYDHMHYLENNWELYDGKTSNHYLSDLVGYFYLCWFFDVLPGIKKRQAWCYQEILSEFEKQIFAEGTSYEGSTAYHTLVTELFEHFAHMCAIADIPLSANFYEKLEKMRSFIDACTTDTGYFFTIGDHDSGKVAKYFAQQNIAKDQGKITNYTSFGLSIIYKGPWHITLRYPAYSNKQPSGHFHNDQLSITLAVNGMPIFVDPGSYLYTPSSFWRNHFRSVTVHNTFYIDGHEPIPFDERLFALAIPEQRAEPNIQENKDMFTITTQHTLYHRFGVKAQRTLEVTDQQLRIIDEWIPHDILPQLVSCHNFTLHPALNIIQCNSSSYIFSHNNVALLTMDSTTSFTLHNGWYAPNYGTKIPTIQLKSLEKLGKVVTTLTKIYE